MKRYAFATSTSAHGGYRIDEATWWDGDRKDWAIQIEVSGHGDEARVKIRVAPGIPVDFERVKEVAPV